MKTLSVALLLMLCVFSQHSQGAVNSHKLRIGVTLHAYYSWVKNIVADRAEVIPILPQGVDPHSYQPRPEDLRKLSQLDVIVSNGLGHDEFLKPMLQAIDARQVIHINPNHNVPLLPVNASQGDSTASTQWNSHSFLSITSAVQQISFISQALADIDSMHALHYKQHARRYIKRLRTSLGQQLARLHGVESSAIKLACVHDAYSYLFQDLGLHVDSVIQPRHGIQPSPKQLADTLKRLQNNQINILFTELDYGQEFSDVIKQETAADVYQLDHISSGQYSADKFVSAMRNNMQTIVNALTSYAE